MKKFVSLLSVVLILSLVVGCKPPIEDTIEKLVKQLGDENYATRENAQKELIRLGNNNETRDDVIKAVNEELRQTEDAEVWVRGRKILNEIEAEIDLSGFNVEQLIKLLGDENSVVRERATEALIAKGEEALPQVIETYKTNGDPEVELKAKKVIQTCKVSGQTTKAIEIFLNIAKDKALIGRREWCRNFAMDKLTDLARAADAELKKKVKQELEKIAKDSGETKTVRGAAQWNLFKISIYELLDAIGSAAEQALDALEQLLETIPIGDYFSDEVRDQALNELGLLHDRETISESDIPYTLAALEALQADTRAIDPYSDIDPTGTAVLWWHSYTGEREEGLQQMVADFNAANEWGIEVAAEYIGGYSEIYDRMNNAIAANDPTLLPNLVVGYASQLAKYQLFNALVDMDEFVDSSRWGLTAEEKADFYAEILESDVNPLFGDGHFRMGFPPNRSMEVLYYNLDWLNEMGYDGPPKTWAEFEEMACAATDPDASTIGYEISTDASRFASMVFSRHGTYFEADGSAFDFTNDTVKETMRFIKEVYDEGCATLIAEPYGDYTDFGNYKCLFIIGSTSGLPFYEQSEFQWDVAPLPYMDTGNTPMMNTYGASVAIPKTTPEQELAAWLFVRWFAQPENLAQWVQISGYFPVRASTAEMMDDYFDQHPTYQEVFDLLKYSTYEAEWCVCYEEVRRLMANAYNSILDGADIDETLAQLEADANVRLAENTP